MSLVRAWDGQAENWARFARTPGHDRAHEDINLPALLDVLPAPGRRTLDVGCGEGRLGRLLRSLRHRVVGIDAAPAMVRLAVTHADQGPALVADAAALPFAARAFDLVVAYMCLHDMDELGPAISEIARVLDRSGRLCAAIPHPINSAGDFQSKEPDAPFVIAGSYLEPFPTTMTSDREGVAMTFHSMHRPLGDIGRALEDAGLLIEAIREPRPDDQHVAGHPAEKRWQRVPMFLHIRAVKAG